MGGFIHQRSDQAQKLLLLQSVSAGEEGSNLRVLNVTARSDIRFMADEHSPVTASEQRRCSFDVCTSKNTGI